MAFDILFNQMLSWILKVLMHIMLKLLVLKSPTVLFRISGSL